MDAEVMLTTFDNPYDPFDDFVQWFMFDIEKGYYTCSRLARIARYSTEFSTIEDKKETERAIDEIIDNDFLNIYKKVTRISEIQHSDEEETAENSVEEVENPEETEDNGV